MHGHNNFYERRADVWNVMNTLPYDEREELLRTRRLRMARIHLLAHKWNTRDPTIQNDIRRLLPKVYDGPDSCTQR